jgi:hypothetical protein
VRINAIEDSLKTIKGYATAEDKSRSSILKKPFVPPPIN